MSFATGHKSPFAERSKATMSHLSPRRTSAASSSRTSAQQSLFGKESSTLNGDSSAKLGQLRNAQPDVKEPTTPTRASEKGNGRDEFSTYNNNRRMGTPIKTPRTAFGTIPPRSAKRPYMGSPKYQKVLLERPAFYNSPGEPTAPTSESGRKEVSISELQKRLKRFLQDENVPSRVDVTPSGDLEDVPYNISRSPRVNPLFHHDETVLHVTKGGVAFTAGVTDATSMHTRPGGVAFTAGVENASCSHIQPVGFVKEDADVSAPLPSIETSPPSPHCDEPASATDTLSPEPQCISDDGASCNEAPQLEQPLRSEDFPVHSEVEDGTQVEEGLADRPSVSVVPESGISAEELDIAGLTSPIVEVQESEGATVVTSSAHEDEQRAVYLETKADSIFEEDEEETDVILESWSQRFLKFVVLAVVVTCVMGFMVLASGSQGLLPQSLHAKTSSFSWSSPVIPVSIGFIGLGREHEGLQCLPAVHLGLKCLSSVCASPHGGSSSSLDTGSVTKKDSKLAGIDNVVDTDQLRTVTDYYKELQGRLFSDVASLTTALSDASKAGTGMEVVSEIEVLDDVAEVAGTEDVTEVAEIQVVSEVFVIEELVSAEDASELVHEIAEKLHLETPHSSDEESEIIEGLPILLDTTTELESHQFPADVQLDSLNHDELHGVPTTTIDTPEPISSRPEIGSELEEVAPSLSMEESSFNDIPSETFLLDVSHITEEEFPVQAADEHIISGSFVNEDIMPRQLVDDHEEEHVNLHGEEPQSQSTTEVSDSNLESTREVITLTNPESDLEEAALHEQGSVEGLYPVATISLLVAALAIAVRLLLKSQKSAPKTVTLASAIRAETAAERNAFPAAQLKTMGSPVAWPAARSVYDSHIPDRDELDVITSPLKGFRTQRNYGLESFKYSSSVEPASSAPGPFQPRARVEPRPATTWHPAMRAGSNTISSSGYRQTASYFPTVPSESGISSSTRATSDSDSVCESALTMGAEEWEHLGSFTASELVSVNEGGEEHKVRTPVRRSQRIRNRVNTSPLPVKFT